MNTTLKDSYEQYHNAGFILQKAARNKKHAFREGSYAERVNEDWDDNATGYVAIIPPNLIIVDNDSYKDEGASLLKLAEHLGYMPEPFALTPSGGEHYAFHNSHLDLVIGNLNAEYPALDIYSGFQSVIPIVGTTVMNKSNELKSYQWANFDDSLFINDYDPQMLTLFKMRERGGTDENQYDEMGLSMKIKEDELPTNEVVALLELIPIETYGYDSGYLKFAMALYDRYEGNAEGLELFQQTCLRYPDNDPKFNEKKWNNGNFKPTRNLTFKTLRSLANEGRNQNIYTLIEKAKSVDDLEASINGLTDVRLNTSSKLDQVVRDELINKLAEKSKELTGKPNKVLFKKALKFNNVKDVNAPEGVQLYLCQGRFIVQNNVTVVPDVGMQMLTRYLGTFEVSKDQQDKLLQELIAVENLRQVPDYMINAEVAFKVEANGGTKLPSLVVRNNPLITVGDYIHDDEILEDFLETIWNGKVDDIVRLVALTIKLREQKLNRLMLVAPSNTGKTEIFTMMGFQKITMKRLLNGLRGDKGIGAAVIDGIRKSALLLIDESNTSLEAEIKDMDKELHVDQFGSGGTQILPLHFTALTSTHKTATRNNSDELYNRFLQVELTPKEVTHTLMQSDVFIRDTDKYTKVVSSYLLSLFRTTILGDEGKEELRLLQEKYRLPRNNDLDALLYELSESFIEETKSSASEEGSVIHKNGEYFYKRKSDITSFFEDRLGEISALDIGKYSELLTTHFVEPKAVSIRVGGKPAKFYKVSSQTYTQDVQQQIIDMFDDLEIEHL